MGTTRLDQVHGHSRRVQQQLAPLRPKPRPIATAIDRNEPKPFSGRVIRTSALTPFAKPPVRPLQVIVDRREPKPFVGHHASLSALTPPLIPAPRPLQTNIDRREPKPFGGHHVSLSSLTPPLIPTPRPLQASIVARANKTPIPPGRIVQIVQRLAPLLSVPRPIQTYLDRQEPKPFVGRHITFRAPAPATAAAVKAVRPLQVVLTRLIPPPGRHASVSALAVLRALPRPIRTVLDRQSKPFAGHHTSLSALTPPVAAPATAPRPIAVISAAKPTKTPIPSGLTTWIAQRLAPLLPLPRPVQVTTDRQEPKPFSGRHQSLSAIAPLRATPRPIQTHLDLREPKPFSGRQATFRPPAPAAAPSFVPRAIQARLQKFVPYAAGRHASLSALTPLAKPPVRPLQVILDRQEPKPFAGARRTFRAPAPAAPTTFVGRPLLVRLARYVPFPARLARRVSPQTAPLIPQPRPVQTRLNRFVPYPIGRALRILQRLAPLIPAPRPIQTTLDRQEPKPFAGHHIALSALTPFAKPPVRPIQVYLDRNEPKPFNGHHSAFPRPAPALPVLFVSRPIAVTRRADPITWRVPVRNGGIIKLRPPVLPVPPPIPVVDSGPGIIGAMTTTLEGQPTSGMIGAMTETLEGRPRP